jgi:hypothetical protein
MLYIQKFIDRIRGNEARGSKDFIMPMTDAKGLHADITDLLLELRKLKENTPNTEEIIQVQVTGGRFK